LIKVRRYIHFKKLELQEQLIELIFDYMALGDNRRNRRKQVYDLLEDEQNRIFERAKVLGKVPNDIEPNSIFKENLFSVFVSIFSRTPLLICGKPGTSKSLTVKIISECFLGQFNHKPRIACFNDFPKMTIYEYQGSSQSEKEELEKKFIKANEKTVIYFIKVIIFDEVGLAEFSKEEPLKVINEYLERRVDPREAEMTSNYFFI
jgi:MoxR-like ATPase